MKTVFSNSELCHVYAQQTQENGQGSSLFFEGPAIYSYGHHFLLGIFLTNDSGKTLLLVNTHHYSSSTAKHQAHLRRAISHLDTLYLPWLHNDLAYNIRRFEGSFADKVRHNTAELVKIWIEKLSDIAKKLSKARKPEIHIQTAQCWEAQIQQYFTFIDAPIPENLIQALEIAHPTPEHIEAIREREKEEARRKAAKTAEQVRKWLNFETDNSGTPHPDILRSSGDLVETSRGIKMTKAQAINIYHQLRDQELKPGSRILDNYTVTSINGTVKIGCHTFDTSYLLTFGANLENPASK